MKRFSVRSMCMSAVIAALYAALTLGFQAISYGPVQFRVSEAMTLLPVLFPEAVPGLAVGCLISNLFNPPISVVFALRICIFSFTPIGDVPYTISKILHL